MGRLNFKSLTDWLKKKLAPPTEEISGGEIDLERRTRLVDNLVVLYTAKSGGQGAEWDMYQELARDFMAQDDVEFVTMQEGVSQSPRLVVYRYRNTQHPKEFKEEKWNIQALSNFIMRSTFTGPAANLIRELSGETALRIFNNNLPLVILFRNTSEPLSHSYYEKEFALAALSKQDQIMACQADINNDIAKKIALLLGLDD